MSDDLPQLLHRIFEAAAYKYTVAYSPTPPTRENRALWPSEISVDDLSLVEAGIDDKATKICALGIGLPSGAAVWANRSPMEVAAIEYILPRAQRQLAASGYSSVINHEIGKKGIKGVVDCIIAKQAAIELKIVKDEIEPVPPLTTHEAYRISLIAWLTSLPVYLVVITLETLTPQLARLSSREASRFYSQAIATAKQYQNVVQSSPPLAPYGNCSLCLCNRLCPIESIGIGRHNR